MHRDSSVPQSFGRDDQKACHQQLNTSWTMHCHHQWSRSIVCCFWKIHQNVFAARGVAVCSVTQPMLTHFNETHFACCLFAWTSYEWLLVGSVIHLLFKSISGARLELNVGSCILGHCFWQAKDKLSNCAFVVDISTRWWCQLKANWFTSMSSLALRFEYRKVTQVVVKAVSWTAHCRDTGTSYVTSTRLSFFISLDFPTIVL